MNIVDIIAKKRDGMELSESEINYFVEGITSGVVADYQAAAMLMAIRIKGMTARETADLTLAMMNSGDVADLSALPGVKADKHSTGGVGDTVSLIALPIAAACGCKIAKMSGRGLGFTGGTIDKMNSIGMKTALSIEEMVAVTAKTGLCVAEQTGSLAPADGILYALRDVTATVDSIPLVASSILSKKLATGSDVIVLDVKCGSGAIFPRMEDSLALAKTMADIGRLTGKRICSLLTDMSQPLGNYIGNKLEVYEAIITLRGENKQSDLLAVSMTVAAKLIELSLGVSESKAMEQAKCALDSGAAYLKLREFVAAQGGDLDAIDNPESLINGEKMDVTVGSAGYYASADAAAIGGAAQMLGAGRMKKSDVIDGDVGIIMRARIGDYLREGDDIATIVYKNFEKTEQARAAILGAIHLSDEKPEKPPLIHAII